jgi:acetyl esterase
MAGRAKHESIKMREKLDPQVAQYLNTVRSRPPAHLLSIETLRGEIDKIGDHYPPEPVGKIEDVDMPSPSGNIPLRVYSPEGKGPFPPVVFFHGGGWCIGSVAGYDGFCSVLTNRVPAVVFSVGYRLAPEHPFPAAIEDCYVALGYIAKNAANFNADPGRLAVIGDSAGGTIAAVMSIKSKKEGGPKIALQVLIYPATDLSHTDSASYKLFGEGYDLDKRMIEIFRSHYLPDKKEWVNPYVSPMLAKDLRGLPKALIITAEYDPMRDDGIEFAARLKKSGVPVRHSMYKGVIHGFLSFTTFHAAQRAFDEISRAF